MARRILSADSVLTPAAQPSLQKHPVGHLASVRGNSVRTETPGAGLPAGLDSRWLAPADSATGGPLFDWADRAALFSEIEFVNRIREKLDEAALKIAPSMLRIVLTVKAHVAGPKAQRAFLAEHVDWDFRRISELCLVAERYGLLEPESRVEGEREIRAYGWSNALKLAYVPFAADRREVWDRARGGRDKASYRAVLEEIQRFRERKLVGPPAPQEAVGAQFATVRSHFESLTALAGNLSTAEECRDALREVGQALKELARFKRVLKERMDSAETEALAASA